MAETTTKDETWPLLGRLWRDYVGHYWPLIAVSTLLMAIEGSTLGLLSYMLKPMFDQVFVAGDAGLLPWVGAAIMGLFVLRAVTGVVSRVMLARVGLLASTRMQLDLIAHMLTLDQPFYAANAPGALMTRVTTDVTAVQNIWQTLIQGAGRDLISLIGLAVVAVAIDVTWALAAIVAVPIVILPAAWLQRYVRGRAREQRDTTYGQGTRLSEIFHGITAVKLNGMEGYQLARFRRLRTLIVSAQTRSTAARAMMPGLIDVVTGLGFFAVLILGGRDILQGDKTVGDFMSFFTAMALTFQPVRRIAGVAGTVQTTAASLEKIYEVFDASPTIVSAAAPAPLPMEPPAIAFDRVTFAYEDDTPVLRGLTFTAEAGRTTALVGASGAGKSTVFALLARLIEPDTGTIHLGGTKLTATDLATLRSRLSVVSQDAALFDETIRENVTLGVDYPPARLQAALDAAHVSDFTATLPQGIETPAGPRGANLSGGQRQRVAIARAILRDTPVLLLDEATSALDAKSEALVQEALERLSKGRTTIVIAHRLATIQNADHIVVMDHGRVAEEGRHGDLITRGGLYADLCRLQFSSNALKED